MSDPPHRVAVRSFATVAELRAAQVGPTPPDEDSPYPRVGTKLLVDTERAVAELAGVEPARLALFGSGMAAFVTAVEIGLYRPGDAAVVPRIACAEQMFPHIRRFLSEFVGNRQVPVARFDSGDPDAMAAVIAREQPTVVIVETIGNGPALPVLDLEALFAAVRSSARDAIVVLDNTLPLSTGCPLAERLPADVPVIVVESGTKGYTLNAEICGLAYAADDALVERLRGYRMISGGMPGTGSLHRIGSLLPATRTAFDDRNRRVFVATEILARALDGAAADVHVAHPALASHPNRHLYRRDFAPDGATPVLFLQCGAGLTPVDLATRLWASPAVRAQTDLGQSFGFDRARIWPDSSLPAVRIAGGAAIDADALGTALRATVAA